MLLRLTVKSNAHSKEKKTLKVRIEKTKSETPSKIREAVELKIIREKQPATNGKLLREERKRRRRGDIAWIITIATFLLVIIKSIDSILSIILKVIKNPWLLSILIPLVIYAFLLLLIILLIYFIHDYFKNR